MRIRLGSLVPHYPLRLIRRGLESSKRNHYTRCPIQEAFIRSHTSPTRSRLTPQIRLHLITPQSPMWTWGEHEMEAHGISPFWAIYWPGGQALTQYILQTPSLVRHKRILDLGAGCGSATVASLLHTADHVIANDIDPYALTAVLLNTELNKLPANRLTLSSTDLLSASDVPDVDVAFVGDMFYDGDMARRMTVWVETARKRGVEVLIGDPGRWAFETRDVQDSDGKERRDMNGLVLEKVHEVRLDKKEEHLQEREFERGIVWRVV